MNEQLKKGIEEIIDKMEKEAESDPNAGVYLEDYIKELISLIIPQAQGQK